MNNFKNILFVRMLAWYLSNCEIVIVGKFTKKIFFFHNSIAEFWPLLSPQYWSGSWFEEFTIQYIISGCMNDNIINCRIKVLKKMIFNNFPFYILCDLWAPPVFGLKNFEFTIYEGWFVVAIILGYMSANEEELCIKIYISRYLNFNITIY